LNNLKQRIIENRFLVFLARFMYKYNKNIVFSTDSCFKLLKKKQSTDKQTINQSIDTTSTTTTPATSPPTPIESIIIVLNEKCHNMCKELIRNYLTLLDNWPACSEFYNQIIEGNLIEHLLWLQFDDKTEMKSITSRSNNNNNNTATKSSSISKSSIKFNYCEYSFNLLYKLCRDYHACRAEFGRNGGLTKFLTRIDQFQTLNKLTNNEMKQIELICFSCKESVNRFRLKEQNHLTALIKLQQRLKKAFVVASNNNNNNNKKTDFCLDSLDATLFNKLLVAICGFVHDQDSMNVLLNNGIIDSFISFLNDSYEQQTIIKNQSKTWNLNQFKEYLNKLKQKSVLIKHLLSISIINNDINNTNKKRKVSDQLDVSNANKPKKSKQNLKLTPSSPLNLMDYSEHIQLQQQLGSSPTESYCSLSPACNPFSPTFSLSSPPTAYNTNSSSTTTLNRMYLVSSAMSPSSSSNDAMAYNQQTSPKFNWSSSNEDLYQMNNDCTIQFSPSIKNEDSDEEEEEEEQQTYDEVEAEVEDTNKLTNNKPAIVTNQQSIETINRTEGCVFYVLSQLSHGDKPSIHLFNNFESITICLLKYLKNAKVRNPRALRILNRLTKNHYCFTFFVSIQLPYRIKEILFNNTTTTPTTGIMNQKKDQDIEKEMNIYLNSNKVFFDAHSSFPSFESIEFTLINNLKSQCISSSDHGYLTLIQMIKLNQKKQDRVCTALVAPFILRNSKALHYIMIQLNGIDLVIDLLFSDCCLENERLKSILCLKKILNFVSYKQDVKKLKENYDLVKIKFNDYYNNNNKSVKDNDDDDDEQIEFILDQQSIKVNRQLVAKKSEYFNTLLNGQFIESNCELSRCIEMKDVSYEPFKLIISLLMQLDLDEIKNELNFELCIETVLVCDRFMLNELKDLFMQILINQFLNLNTFILISKLGWYLNNSSLEQAAVDYFLSKFISFNDFDDLDMNLINNNDDYYLNKLSNFVEFTLECLLSKQDCLIMTRIESNQQQQQQQQQQQETKQFLDFFKKSLKNTLGEIVKK
jgi:hypothetical protein